MLAISSDPNPRPIDGRETHEPAFGAPAQWIQTGFARAGSDEGYVVVDHTSVLATHLAEIVRQPAHELLTRQEAKRLLDALADKPPKLVEELVPTDVLLLVKFRVLQQLLREHVKIRDLGTILEVLLDTAASQQGPDYAGRSPCAKRLGRSLVQPLLASGSHPESSCA